MLQVGMRVLIIGASTAEGQKWIGSDAHVHQILNTGDVIDPGLIVVPDNLKLVLGPDYRIRWTQAHAGVIVFKEGIYSVSNRIRPDFAIFKAQHVMPIPPLEEPGIDECTFTPIVQKETV